MDADRACGRAETRMHDPNRLEEHAVPRHRVIDPRQGHEQSQQAAEHRDDHDGRKYASPRRAEQRLTRLRGERFARCHAVERH